MRQHRPRPSATREGGSPLFVRKCLAPASGPGYPSEHTAPASKTHPAANIRLVRAAARASVRTLRLPAQDGSRCEPPAHPHAARDMSERCNREGRDGSGRDVWPVRASPGVCPDAAIAGARWSVAAARLVRAGQGLCPDATTIGGKMSPVAINSAPPDVARAFVRTLRPRRQDGSGLQSPGRPRRPWAFVRTPRTQGRPASQSAARRFGPIVRHHPAAALAWATVPHLRIGAASVARSAHRARGALRYTTLKTLISTAARCGRKLSSVPTYTPRFSQACGPSGAVISSVEKA